jgi:hypothetical protein
MTRKRSNFYDLNSELMSTGRDYSSAKAAETVTNLQRFMKEAPQEIGINWAAFVILAALASPDVLYLTSTEIIQKTGLNRGWAYRNIRILVLKGLIDSVKQIGSSGNQARALYSINGKGNFYLTQAVSPNGIGIIKALERSNG